MTDNSNSRDARPPRRIPVDDTHDTDIPEQRTVEFSTLDPHATVDPNETIAIDVADDLDETIDPYGTVDSSDPRAQISIGQPIAKPASTGASTVLPEAPAELDKTVEFGDADQTVQFTPSEFVDALSNPNDKAKKTVPTEVDQTVEVGDLVAPDNHTAAQGSTAVDEPRGARSVMLDTNVSQTLNPREMSAEDAAFWGSLSRIPASGSQPSRLSPAINRSLSETKLILRDQMVTDARNDSANQSDYRLVRLLGKGGMGNVYVARQGSLDRLVALKVIKPLEEEKRKRFAQKGTLEQVEKERRLQFISEAVVTGDLDHPNIVPIHDIAVTGDNTLFYSMKRVSGTPWSKAIAEKTRDENIDILLKVCDAIGFAHTRGVVHRDIKPENIMLGEFGVVMVMDWGLALAKPEFDKLDSVHQSTSLGGSPAYMAPEMVIGPVDRIGPASDVYLLGATLFQIITGHAPHHATNVSECLKAVASNKIREIPKEHQSELMNVALKAMSTKLEERYPNVAEFQASIREYRSHSESIALAARAADVLANADVSADYDDYSRSMFGFEEAITLWSGNTKAVEGLANAKLEYAEAAYRKGDFDLGLSVLERDDPTHQSLIEQLEAGKELRRSRDTRFALLRKAAAAMLAFIIIGGGYAIYRIRQEANEAKNQTLFAEAETKKAVGAGKAETAAKLLAVAEKNKAELATLEAERQKAVQEELRIVADKATADAVASELAAKEDRAKAIASEIVAKEDREKAVSAELKAVEKSQEALYESYVSNIGLAKSRIEQNMFGDASTILQRLHSSVDKKLPAWEWRWLWRQTTRAVSSITTDGSPAKSIHFSGPTGTVATVLESGSVQLVSVDSTGHLLKRGSAMQMLNGDVSTLTFAPSLQSILIGTQSGDIEVWDSSLTKKTLNWYAHKATINKLQFVDERTLVSASDDHSIRLWDLTTQTELTTCWNLGPVKDFSVVRTGATWTLVAAIAESTSGRATVWTLTRDSKGWASKLSGEFLEHRHPVTSVAISPTDGQSVVSGASDGTVFVWQANAIQVTDYAREIGGAIKKLSSKSEQSGENKRSTTEKNAVEFQRLVDPDLLIADSTSERAHGDRVRVVRFSPDGKTILTGGDDYLIRLWDAASAKRIKDLRGHGGWVLDADFADQSGDLIVSCSADETVRTWQPAAYINASVSNRPLGNSGKMLHEEEILSARLNQQGTAVVTASRDRTAIVSQINPLTMSLERIAALRDETDLVALKEGTTFIAQSYALDYENSLLYVASADAIVRVWNFKRGTELFKIENTGLNTSLALSRDGRYLLTRSSDLDTKSILWRLDTTGRRPPQIVHRLGGHHKELAVTALAVSSDGSRLFTADNVGIGILWNGKTGEQMGLRLEIFRGYRINAAEFSASGEELFVAADDQQLSRIRLSDRSVISQFHHDGFVSSFSLSDDNHAVVTVSEEKTSNEIRSAATLWNLDTGTRQFLDRGVASIEKTGTTISQHTRITSAQFGPGGQLIAIGKEEAGEAAGRIAIWSLASEKAVPVHAFKLPTTIGAPAACVPLPGGRMLTINGDSAFQWAWDAGDKTDASKTVASKINSYRANAAVHSANFTADGKFVITGSHSVKIWDLETKKSIAKVELPHDGPMLCVEPTPRTGSYQFATSGSDGTVKLFDFDPATFTTKVLKTWMVGNKNIAMRRVCFSDDGSMLLAVGDNGTIRLFRTDGDFPESIYDTPAAGQLLAAAFSSDGKYILVSGGDDNDARIWDVVEAGVTNAAEPIILSGHDDQIEDVRFLSHAAGPLRVFTASRDKSARVWDPRIGSVDRRGREVLNLLSHSLGVTAVDATKNGNVVITAGNDGTLIVWPASDLAEIALINN